jgi:hypothetical protein
VDRPHLRPPSWCKHHHRQRFRSTARLRGRRDPRRPPPVRPMRAPHPSRPALRFSQATAPVPEQQPLQAGTPPGTRIRAEYRRARQRRTTRRERTTSPAKARTSIPPAGRFLLCYDAGITRRGDIL